METNNLWNKEVVIVGLSFILEKDFSVQLGNHHRLKILLPKKKSCLDKLFEWNLTALDAYFYHTTVRAFYSWLRLQHPLSHTL